MSQALRRLFAVHAVVASVSGALLLVAPGRTLLALGWWPIDPIISRLLGAALLGMAWSSVRGWQSAQRPRVQLVLELEAVFAVLACVGLLRHLLFANWPLMVWLLLGVLVAFAASWIAALMVTR